MNRLILFLIFAMILGRTTANAHKNQNEPLHRPIADALSQKIRNGFEQVYGNKNHHAWLSDQYRELYTSLSTAGQDLRTFIRQNGYTDLTDNQVAQIQDDLKTFQQTFDRLNALPIPTPTPTPTRHQP